MSKSFMNTVTPVSHLSSCIPCALRLRNFASKAVGTRTSSLETKRLVAFPKARATEANSSLANYTNTNNFGRGSFLALAYGPKRKGKSTGVRCQSATSDEEPMPLADRKEDLTRQEVLDIIKEEAPFVISRDAFHTKVQYTPAVEWPTLYTKGGQAPAQYILYSMHLRAALPTQLQGYNFQVTRVFQGDPNTVIVRWKIMWLSEDIPRTMNGNTKYLLDSTTGRIANIVDLWEMQGEERNGEYFQACFNFTQAWRPLGVNKLSDDCLPVALKYAAWETLKDNEMFGGTLVREELDEITMQMFWASVAFVGSWALFFVVLFFQILASVRV